MHKSSYRSSIPSLIERSDGLQYVVLRSSTRYRRAHPVKRLFQACMSKCAHLFAKNGANEGQTAGPPSSPRVMAVKTGVKRIDVARTAKNHVRQF